ncbi:hypothetical protein QAD02_013011 [Eretmocerus hayati]|uniref:Uncharacterized protein n=1 Tax=Eretmocerus hayati TaxID=131215 RepID=A0ACC2P3W2_9HYME|nr:hypothetical protein QAD02_013011 [Eretmocerus hayati]
MPSNKRPNTRSQSRRDQDFSLPSGGIPPATPPTRNLSSSSPQLPPAGFNLQPAWYERTLSQPINDVQQQHIDDLDPFANRSRIHHSFEAAAGSSTLDLDARESLLSSTAVEGEDTIIPSPAGEPSFDANSILGARLHSVPERPKPDPFDSPKDPTDPDEPNDPSEPRGDHSRRNSEAANSNLLDCLRRGLDSDIEQRLPPDIADVSQFVKEAVKIERELEAKRSLRQGPTAHPKAPRKNIYECHICDSNDHADKECPRKPTMKPSANYVIELGILPNIATNKENRFQRFLYNRARFATRWVIRPTNAIFGREEMSYHLNPAQGLLTE